MVAKTRLTRQGMTGDRALLAKTHTERPVFCEERNPAEAMARIVDETRIHTNTFKHVNMYATTGVLGVLGLEQQLNNVRIC